MATKVFHIPANVPSYPSHRIYPVTVPGEYDMNDAAKEAIKITKNVEVGDLFVTLDSFGESIWAVRVTDIVVPAARIISTDTELSIRQEDA